MKKMEMEKKIQPSDIQMIENQVISKNPEVIESKIIYKAHDAKDLNTKPVDLSELMAEFRENILLMFLM